MYRRWCRSSGLAGLLLTLLALCSIAEPEPTPLAPELVASVPGSDGPLPMPIPGAAVSPRQRATRDRIAQTAADASRRATAAVEAALSDPEFRAHWRRMVSPELAALSSSALLQRIRDEVAATEVVHSFPSSDHNPDFREMLVDDWNFTWAARFPFYTNARAMYYAGIRDVSNLRVASRWHTENVAEELMGFPKFTETTPVPNTFGLLHVTWPGSWDEAFDRPLYTASNLQRAAFPVDQHFGDIGIVLRRRYVDDAVVMTPSDTGWKAGVCNWLQADSHGAGLPPFHLNQTRARPAYLALGLSPTEVYNCTAWDLDSSALGMPGHMDHLILPNVMVSSKWFALINMSAAEGLARQYARLLDDNATTFDLRNDPNVGFSLSGAFVSMYMEHNLVKNVFFHERSIKLVLASFSELFGSEKGGEVQRWAIKNGWLLAWAVTPASDKAAKYMQSTAWRVLDPTVAAQLRDRVNLPDDEGAQEAMRVDRDRFQSDWDRVAGLAAARGGHPWDVPYDDYLLFWMGLSTNLQADTSLLRVPRKGQCMPDPDECVGITSKGFCVCYTDGPREGEGSPTPPPPPPHVGGTHREIRRLGPLFNSTGVLM